jgi:diguanylate cyclase (GGDEF)-like protein
MELKRAKRYGYSLAAALVQIDPPDVELSPVDTRRLRERVAVAITSNIRDIDYPVEHVDGRVLIFLPYTDLDGATEVGNRVVKAVRKLARLETDEGEVQATISVGISAQREGQPISFARLMRDANQALRAAALKGGNRVVIRQ